MAEPGRIILVNSASRARGGGTGIALLAARLLRARGYEVVFITGDDGDSPALWAADVRVVALGGTTLMAGSRLSAMRDGIWNAAAADFLGRWIAREGRDDDVWHLHGWSQVWSPSVFSALAPVRGRLVVHAHDYFSACPNGAFWDYRRQEICARIPLSGGCIATNCDKRSGLQKAWRLLRQRMVGQTFTGPGAPLLLLIHPGMAVPFARAGISPRRMSVLRNPVTPFQSERIPAEDNAGLLFVGRLDEEKGALPLARAAAAAGVPVTFVGEGGQAAAVARACPGAEMTGWLDHAGIRAHAVRSRALVMPSLYPEPFGLVAAEAMGAGLPVAASHSALLAREIVQADAGWAVDIRDEAGLARTLRQIADAPRDAIARKSRNALAVARSAAFSPDEWCARLEEIYRAVLAGSGDQPERVAA